MVVHEITETSNIFDKSILDKLYLILRKNYYDLVLFGTGKNYSKVPKGLMKFLIKNKIKYETMTSLAAYNTYNILLSENRNFYSIIKLV